MTTNGATMTTDVVTDWIPETSPRSRARIAGVFYLVCVVTGMLAVFGGANLVASGDPAKTAANILAQETFYRTAFAAGFIATAAYIVVAVLFYDLFRPVNRTVSLIAVLFNVLGCAVGAVSSVCGLAPFILLGKRYLVALNTEQLQALTYAFLKFGDEAGNISLIFFGFYMALIGYLIVKSTFLPRVLGLLVILAGLSYLTFLWPPLANAILPFSLIPIMLGELGLTLWLLAAGVNAQRWCEMAGAAAARHA